MFVVLSHLCLAGDWLWSLHTLAVPAALRIVFSSWRAPVPVPAHQSILLLSAAAGVMDVSVQSFAGVFPVTSLVYLVSHLAYNWSSNNVWLVAASIATFNFNPVVVYLLARYSMHQAQGLQAATLTAVRHMAGNRLSSKLHMQLAKACAVTSMLLVFGVFGKVLTMQGMKPPAVVTQAAEEAKLVLWDMAARMKLVGEWQVRTPTATAPNMIQVHAHKKHLCGQHTCFACAQKCSHTFQAYKVNHRHLMTLWNHVNWSASPSADVPWQVMAHPHAFVSVAAELPTIRHRSSTNSCVPCPEDPQRVCRCRITTPWWRLWEPASYTWLHRASKP